MAQGAAHIYRPFLIAAAQFCYPFSGNGTAEYRQFKACPQTASGGGAIRTENSFHRDRPLSAYRTRLSRNFVLSQTSEGVTVSYGSTAKRVEFFRRRCYSTTHRAKLVQVEEALLETPLDSEIGNQLYKIICSIVHHAEGQKFGCTLILDLNKKSKNIVGQKLLPPLDLREDGH